MALTFTLRLDLLAQVFSFEKRCLNLFFFSAMFGNATVAETGVGSLAHFALATGGIAGHRRMAPDPPLGDGQA